MYYLIYMSTPDSHLGDAQIEEMLKSSRDSNQNTKITGCLLHYHDRFLQYLEGGQIEVIGLFDKIKQDPRHSQVTVLSHGIMASKVFDLHNMVYENFRSADHKLEYLGILVSSHIEAPQRALDPDPTSKRFWITAKKLLDPRLKTDLTASGN